MMILATVSTFLNVVFLLIALLSMRGLHWKDKQERITIVGFVYMIAVIVLDIIAINILVRI